MTALVSATGFARRKPANRNSSIVGGSGALAEYIDGGSAPSAMQTGIFSPRSAISRQCAAPTLCRCQCMGALNTAYDVPETRSWLKQQSIRLITFALGSVIVIVSTLIFLNGEGIADLVGKALHLGPAFVFLWKAIQFPMSVVGLMALAYTTFYFLPDVRQRKSHVVIAAALTTIFWILATLVFRLYVKHFPPNPAYGLIGGVIIMTRMTDEKPARIATVTKLANHE